MASLAERVKAHPSNFGARRGIKIDMLVLHTTEASAKSAVTWFSQDHRPFGKGASSAHYVVSENGLVFECVHEDDCAFHCGNLPYNRRSVGIEIEGYAEKPEFPDAQWTALVKLCRDVIGRHGIPVDREHVLGHREIPDPYHPGKFGGAGNHVDPGAAFPWDRLMGDIVG